MQEQEQQLEARAIALFTYEPELYATIYNTAYQRASDDVKNAVKGTFKSYEVAIANLKTKAEKLRERVEELSSENSRLEMELVSAQATIEDFREQVFNTTFF